ncbi:hypothetical protein [Pseudomonas aeruginosa]|uniref:hypothetical protein n=1 Tax=Pseudomonas aeruginosa TaxID=287 RepID=UPI003D059DBF
MKDWASLTALSMTSYSSVADLDLLRRPLVHRQAAQQGIEQLGLDHAVLLRRRDLGQFVRPRPFGQLRQRDVHSHLSSPRLSDGAYQSHDTRLDVSLGDRSPAAGVLPSGSG